MKTFALGLFWILPAVLMAGAALAGEQAEPASQVAKPAASFPRIAMFWSVADGAHAGRAANMARHDVIVVNIDQIGLRWRKGRYRGMVSDIRQSTYRAGRDNLSRIRKNNPRAVVLCQVFFFEQSDAAFPESHPWWLRDKSGKRKQFWPGTHQMDLSNSTYVDHVVRRVKSVREALGPLAGIFFDNLRFTPESKAAWINLLKKVRTACGDDMPILVNAGWSSTDLAWVAPYVHGIQFEDAIHHLSDKAADTERFYARVAKFDALVRRPSISVNEVYGKRTSLMRRTRELIRTLAYTNAAYLYADSTRGHRHAWHPEWSLQLGAPAGKPVVPAPGRLARRDFTGGTVLWLPASAQAPRTVKLRREMRVGLGRGIGMKVSSVPVNPGEGVILLKQ